MPVIGGGGGGASLPIDLTSGVTGILPDANVTDVLTVATGSTIENVPIGQTTPSTGNFTRLAAQSLGLSTITKTANYTLTANDCVVLVDASAGNITLTLPDASTVQNIQYIIKKVDTTGFTVTIAPVGLNLIDDEDTLIIRYTNSAAVLHSDGSHWNLV